MLRKEEVMKEGEKEGKEGKRDVGQGDEGEIRMRKLETCILKCFHPLSTHGRGDSQALFLI